jgi:hypothetical protein
MQRFYFYKIENRFEDGEPDYDEAAPDERVRQRHPTQASHVRFGIPSLCACLSTLGCALRSKKQHRSPHPAYQPTHHRQRHLFNTRHAPSTISTRELTSSIIINLWKHSDCEGPEAPQGEGSPEEAVLPGHPPFCPAHTCTLKSRAHTHTRTHDAHTRAHTHTHIHTHTHTHTHSHSLTLTHKLIALTRAHRVACEFYRCTARSQSRHHPPPPPSPTTTTTRSPPSTPMVRLARSSTCRSSKDCRARWVRQRGGCEPLTSSMRTSGST